MFIARDDYLNKLKSKMHNERIKIITGIRRSGKSFLMNRIFKEYLISKGVNDSQIIQIALDDIQHKRYRDPDKCYEYVRKIVSENSLMHYILLDEVQMMNEFSDVLNGFLHFDNVDVYVTGSNSKFLSKDVVTEFRGRGDEIRIYPLTFKEFYSLKDIPFDEAFKEYYTYGGLPYILRCSNYKEKIEYLKKLFTETYIKDIVERNAIQNDRELDIIIDIMASSIGSLTNPQRISNTFKSKDNVNISLPTIKKYIDHLRDSFLVTEVKRFDLKGRKYIGTPCKYYFEDVGLRNARLNFRQQEPTHIMENIIFNELSARGYSIDIGIIDIRERKGNGYQQKRVEIDFVVYDADKKYYIQSAYHLPTEEKKIQEERPLIKIDDSFKKIVIVNDNIMLKRDENGIVTMGIKEFLLNKFSLEL